MIIIIIIVFIQLLLLLLLLLLGDMSEYLVSNFTEFSPNVADIVYAVDDVVSCNNNNNNNNNNNTVKLKTKKNIFI